MNSIYIQNNITTMSFIVLVICVFIVYEVKPSFIYNIDGSFKKFGLGNNSKTIIPIWGFILILAILIYTGLRFLSIIHKL